MFKRLLNGFTHLFKDLPQLPKKLNQTRRIATIEMIFTLTSFAYLFTYAKETYDSDLIMYIAIVKAIGFLSDIFLHIAQKSSYYIYSMVFSGAVLGGYLAMVYFIANRMYTLIMLCMAVQQYYNRIGGTSSVEYICSNLKLKYIFWVAIESMLAVLKGIMFVFILHSMVIIRKIHFMKSRRKEWKEGDEDEGDEQEKEKED